MTSPESGFEFEARGIVLARALHDPAGTQGAVMHGGRERDGLFVSHDDIHAYEFTTDRTKIKADKDGQKLAQLLMEIGNKIDNKYKPRTGWFVTRDEPTAEQRSVLDKISQKSGERIYAVSISTLHQRMCNSELYIQKRDNAPFGSAGGLLHGYAAKQTRPNVSITLDDADGVATNLSELTSRLLDADRALITGNFGVGKSHILREVYIALRKQHFKNGKLTPFPIHINLKDCAGLRTPAEILRRHAEEIGFEHPSGLIAAWRAGACVLLLDGFDEVVPSRWLGGAADLRSVRWEALSPIRRLIEESPENTGIAVAGRSHYFSGNKEMGKALGFKNAGILQVPDFNEDQLRDFLKQSGVSWDVPDWVPMRPLLLGYLVDIQGTDAQEVFQASTRAHGWRTFFDAICAREAQIFTAVRPETIRSIVSRVATLARSKTDITGPVSIEMLRQAFESVNGFQPDEEGMQLLLRLPGLAASNDHADSESRVFADRDLADTAYGLELFEYIRAPHADNNPLSSVASWVTASSALGIEVVVDALSEIGAKVGGVVSVLTAREKAQKNDAVMADLLQVAMTLDWEEQSLNNHHFLVVGVYFDELDLAEHPLLDCVSFQDCVIENLDLSGLESGAHAPHFNRILIGLVQGMSNVPDWLKAKFDDCTIDRFESGTQTTSEILQLDIDRKSKIALTVLKKVFDRRGSGRKVGALSRGLPLNDRQLVPDVLDELVSQGWLKPSTAGRNRVYLGMKERRRDAKQALEFPGEFKL